MPALFSAVTITANMQKFLVTQYTMAVCLIISSIAMVSYQVIELQDVANGLLIYIGQAFLLAGSIFGLDYYVKLITRKLNRNTNATDTNPSNA